MIEILVAAGLGMIFGLSLGYIFGWKHGRESAIEWYEQRLIARYGIVNNETIQKLQAAAREKEPYIFNIKEP